MAQHHALIALQSIAEQLVRNGQRTQALGYGWALVVMPDGQWRVVMV